MKVCVKYFNKFCHCNPLNSNHLQTHFNAVAHWYFCDTHVQEPIAALLRFAATPGSDNPASRYPSLSHHTPRSHFMEERQAMRYIGGVYATTGGQIRNLLILKE